MSFSKYMIGLAAIIALTACGGGGGSAGTVNGAQPATVATAPLPVSSAAVIAAAPSSVEVLTSASSLPSSGGDVVITAFVKNAANVGMAGQAVTFSASSGTLQGPSATTDAQGAATAKLITGGDKSSRNISVTVAAGTASGSVVVQVTGTRVSISGSGSLQAGSAAAQYVVRAADSSGNNIGGASLTVVSSLGNAISGGSLMTDSTGSATFLYTPNNAGTDTVTVSGLGISATATVLVSAIDFVALSPANNAVIPIGGSQIVQVRYRNLGAGVPGQAVSFNTTRGTFAVATAITDASGVATASLSSTTAGPAAVSAQIAGVGAVNLPVQFVATTPSSIVVQANPGGVLPNASGAVNQSSIEAVVRDANGNAVANRQVNFSTLQDLSNGTLSPGSATTDANGRAQVQFIPGASSTPANGVIIQAEVASTAIKSTTSLTVNGQSLFITIGFGNTIGNVDETTYTKDFSVYVTDANGAAVGNQQISLSAIPTLYYKGALSYNGKNWGYSVAPTVCANEDINLNGILDGGEDTNRNGQLTPGNIVVAAPGSVVTNAFGRATFALQYGEQFAPWATVDITARATVAGTESRRTITYGLTGLASDFTAETIPPAGAASPFGTSTSCTNPN
jgi:Bacterial Ig-like domain (group 1)